MRLPAIYLEHDGVTIWHTYKEGSSSHARIFWFTTSVNCGEGFCSCRGRRCTRVFDARDLAAYQKPQSIRKWEDEERSISSAIKGAIDNGALTQAGLYVQGARR